jgi:hypothetical protein
MRGVILVHFWGPGKKIIDEPCGSDDLLSWPGRSLQSLSQAPREHTSRGVKCASSGITYFQLSVCVGFCMTERFADLGNFCLLQTNSPSWKHCHSADLGLLRYHNKPQTLAQVLLCILRISRKLIARLEERYQLSKRIMATSLSIMASNK